jgi:glutamate--cysteine ligase
MPKGRYRIMRDYMPKKGGQGLDMMLRTSTVQVNLDFSSEADMVRKLRVSLALQPIATALFAASPFVEGRPVGFQSWRSQVWTDTDPDRCGMLRFVFDEGFGFERYADWLLHVPMYFVYRDKRHIDVAGQSFRAFITGQLPQLPGERARIGDWSDHVTTAFPEVRLKRYIEMRGADSGPRDHLVALAALWVGLLYSDVALDAAGELVRDWSIEDHERLRNEVPRDGLRVKFRKGDVRRIALDVVAIAKEGLRLRGLGEEQYLVPLEEIAETGRTLADRMLDDYKRKWAGRIDPIFNDYAC